MKNRLTPVPLRSPCVQVCEMDPATNLRRGCLRTRDEREWWPADAPDQQREVLARCDRRRERLRGGGRVALPADMGPVRSRPRPA